jgi:thiol reductant ABC exporter CydD subunit
MGVLSGASTVATAFALSALVVAVVDGRPLTEPARWLGGLFLVRAVLAAGNDTVSAWAGVTVSTRLRSALLRRWASLDADSRPERGTAVNLATAGATAVEPYAARFLPTLVTAAVVPGLAIVTLALVDWPSAVIVVLTVPLLPLFAALIGKATADSTEKRWQALAQLSGHFLDVVRGLPTLVAYGRAERQVEVVRDVSLRHRRATMDTLRIAFLSSAALELLATISVALVAVTVGLRLSYGSMDLGHALVAILLAPEAYWPIRRVGAEYHAAADGAVALDEILDHLDTPPHRHLLHTRPDQSVECPQPGVHLLHTRPDQSVECPQPAGHVLHTRPDQSVDCPQPARSTARVLDVVARRVSYRYPGSSVDVISGLDLTAGPGLTAVTGPSGVGKSTLLELLAGLRLPTAGTITAPASHLVTQRPFIAAGTIRDALTIGHPATDEALWDALRHVGLDGVVAGLDGGLGARLGDDGFGLSAGQRQRLALARAWLSPEPLLLLDEPTAHLDGEAADEANALIAELAQRRTVVAVTHRPELLTRADAHIHLTRTTTEVTA